MATELDRFISEYVTALMRRAGYRKSGHTFHKVLGNDDRAFVQLRNYPRGEAGSFILEVGVICEPIWDLENYFAASPFPTMHRDPMNLTAVGTVSWSWQIPPPERLDIGRWVGSWAYADVAGGRATRGQQIGQVLRDKVLPLLEALLDRDVLLEVGDAETLPNGVWTPPHFEVSFQRRAALLADRGPSTELDQILQHAERHRDQLAGLIAVNEQLLQWAPERLRNGPVWRARMTEAATKPSHA